MDVNVGMSEHGYECVCVSVGIGVGVGVGVGVRVRGECKGGYE
jgi:hypothetical protein